MEFSQFKLLHSAQLARLPERYWLALFHKLQGEVYDAGEHFTMSPEGGRWRVLVSARRRLRAEDPRQCVVTKRIEGLPIFLIDHAWTFRPEAVGGLLASVPGLAARMAALVDVWGVPDVGGGGGSEGEEGEEDLYDSTSTSNHSADSASISSEGEGGPAAGEGSAVPPPRASATPPPSEQPHHCHAHTRHRQQIISASDSSDEEVAPKPDKPHLTLLPGNDSPGFESGGAGYESYAGCESVEEGGGEGEGKEGGRESESVSSNEPDAEKLPEHLRAAVGGPAQPPPPPPLPTPQEEPSHIEEPATIEEESAQEEEGREGGEGEEGREGEGPVTEEEVKMVLERMWKFANSYTVNNSPVPLWYIMDEFGSRIQHSDEPSVAMVAFFFIPAQLAFTLMWPLRDLQFGDELTVDCVPWNVTSRLERACHLLALSRDCGMALDDPLWASLPDCTPPPRQERCGEEYALLEQATPPPRSSFKVFTDMELVRSFLTHPAFQLTSSREDADILWLTEHFKTFSSLKPYQYVNQFPCENVVTCKDLLVTVAQRASQRGADSPEAPAGSCWPAWFPVTFNLLYELPRLVRCFLERRERGEENVWILKPWNLGRGMDIHITAHLPKMIRLAQSGPKVASRYITEPVLFQCSDVGLVKFDVRYVVMLLSSAPPTLYAYNVFWLRFANKPFSLCHFDDYQVHFTVMNYQQEAELKQIHCHDFVPQFERQYPQHRWSTVQDSIFSLLGQLFGAACSLDPPAGIGRCAQSRGMYAVDLMLEWCEGEDGGRGLRPQLLEVNYSPDCVRACRYHPLFYNHVFETLFVDPAHWRPDLPVTQLL